MEGVGSASAAPRSAADAVIDIGSDVVPDDLAANHRRVGGGSRQPYGCGVDDAAPNYGTDDMAQ